MQIGSVLTGSTNDALNQNGGTTQMEFSEDEVYTIFSFIRNHEKEDVPEDVWELSERIYEWMYENS